MSKVIPFYHNKPTIHEMLAILSVVKKWELSSEVYTDELESKFARYVGAKHAISVNSCTSGIHLLLWLLKPEQANIPTMTFVSVANTIKNLGVELQFRDEVSPGRAYAIKTDKGYIVDSAHEAYEDQYKDLDELSDGDPIAAAVYSFYPTKNIASAEGGMIVTDDDELAAKLRLARSHGMKRDGYSWDYTVEFPGWKMNMNSIQAVLAIEQLKHIDDNNELRNEIVLRYDKAFGQKNNAIGNHIYKLKVDNRDKFIEYMAEQGISCSVHFKPIHTQPAYSEFADQEFPNTMEDFETNVSIPLWPQLTLEEVNYIIEKVYEYRENN